jgi:hypothetical protein
MQEGAHSPPTLTMAFGLPALLLIVTSYNTYIGISKFVSSKIGRASQKTSDAHTYPSLSATPAIFELSKPHVFWAVKGDTPLPTILAYLSKVGSHGCPSLPYSI